MKATPVLFAAALAATGCRAPLGPKTIPPARLNYNEAISRSWDEQLLLNLVRLRYRDNPLFVDVTSVSASSKTRFGLLRLILFLKSGDTKEPSPLITISR